MKKHKYQKIINFDEQKQKTIGTSITTPVSLESKIDFEAEDDEEAVMILTNKFNNEKFVRPLPSTVDSEQDQLKCHRGILDIEAEEANTLDIQTEQKNEFQNIYAHPGYSDLLAVRKSARVRPIRTGDDNDATRAKVSKQKVKKTTKVAIEPTSKMYATTSNSRRIKRSIDSPATPVPNRKSEEGKTKTPELLETIQEVTENVEILEEPTQQMEQEPVQAEETTSSYQNNAEIINSNQETNTTNNQVPATPGLTHKEKLKARRIAKHKKLLEEKRSQGTQTLPRVTEAQFVD